MGEGDTEVGFGALCISFLCGLEVVKSRSVCAAVQIDEPAIDISIDITRLHDVCVCGTQCGVGAVGHTCCITDHEDLLPVVLAGDCPDTVELCPICQLSVDIGAVRTDEIVARVNDRVCRPFFAAVGEEMLDVGACAGAHIGEGEPLCAVPRGSESAKIVLLPVHVAAIGKESRFLKRLRERDIGTDALVLRFLVVCVHEFCGRTRELWIRVAAQKVGQHLFFGCRCLTGDGNRGRCG